LKNILNKYNLTNSQIKAVNKILKFLKSNKEVFILKGYAGVGKTFLVKLLVDYFDSINKNYVLMAPTGKAARVLSSKTQKDARTIHSILYQNENLKEYKDKKDKTFKFYFTLRPNNYSNDTVYIVDEASMVSDKFNEMEFIRFGSGFLLKDLFDFVNFDANKYTKKIIFIGDNAQLPPVGMSFSPALNKEYLENTYNIKVDEFELTEVVRQKCNSGILQNSIKIRDKLKKKVFNELTINFSHDVIKIDNNILEKYLEISGNKISKDIMIVAHQNETVKKYNQIIREYFFDNPAELQEKDKLIIVKNAISNGLLLSNGDFCLIDEIYGDIEHKSIPLNISKKKEGKKTKYIDLYFRDVSIVIRNLKGKPIKINTKILENVLFSSSPTISSDEAKALYIDFRIRHPKLKPNTSEFKTEIEKDPYFNALIVKFGYAITCHKAQGSEWKNVIVDCSFKQNVLNEKYFRWLYTAMTRASEKLFLINPPNIKMFDGLQKNMKIKNSNIKAITKTNKFIENQFNIENEFLLELYKYIYNIIKPTGVIIEDIKHYNYQEQYTFKKDNNYLNIAIFYNSKNKITKVNYKENNELKNILNPLKKLENSIILIKSNIIFDDKNLEEIFKEIKRKLYDLNIEIVNIQHFPYRERYLFTNEKENATIDIIYNSKYMIKSFSLVEGSGELYELILEKLQG
jgi:hypothetical protein